MGTEGATADFRAIFEDVMARQLDGRVRGSPVILLPFGGEVTLQWTSVPVRGEGSRSTTSSVAIGNRHF